VPLQRFGTRSRHLGGDTDLLSPAAAIYGIMHPVDGGTPNARTTWKLGVHNRSVPFEGFHRSKLPGSLEGAVTPGCTGHAKY